MPFLNDVVLSEETGKKARWAFLALGIVASILFILKAVSVAGWAIGLLVSFYILGMGITMIASKAAEDGLTVRETTRTLLWFLDFKKLLSTDGRSSLHIHSSTDTSRTLIGEQAANLVSYALVFVGALVAATSGYECFVNMLGAFIWMAVWAWVAGMSFYYLLVKPWRGGLTALNVGGMLLWFVAFLTLVRKRETAVTA
jgi:hypothetical protein